MPGLARCELSLTSYESNRALGAGLTRAVGWVEQHLSAFDPFTNDRVYSVVFAQRVGELAVAVYAHCMLLPDQAAQMAPLIDMLDAVRRRPNFSHRVLRHPAEFVLNAEVYGILRRLQREDLEHRALVQRAIDAGLLDQVERYPHRELDVRLALDWAGVDHPWPSMSEIAYKSPLLRKRPSALFLDEATTYALTHLVMFITDFGVRRDTTASYPALLSVELFDGLIAAACLDRHWDLLGELLFCVEALGLPSSDVCEQGWSLFLALQHDDGSFPGPHRTPMAALLAGDDLCTEEQREVEIAHHYHTTLVAWFAMANRLGPESHTSSPILSTFARNEGLTDAVPRPELTSRIVRAGTTAREWLRLQAEKHVVTDAVDEGSVCSLIVGLYICDELLPATTTSSAIIRRLALRLRDDMERNSLGAGASIKTRFFVASIAQQIGAEIPISYAEQMLRTALVFREEDELVVPVCHGPEIEEKRALLALFGLCQPADRFLNGGLQQALERPLLGADRHQLEQVLTWIEIASCWGTKHLSGMAVVRSRSVFHALATAYLRQYDFNTGCRVLRALNALGAQSTELADSLDYLLLHQRPDGCFGFFGIEASDLRARGPEGEYALGQLELVATVASIWTLAEVAKPSRGFPRSVPLIRTRP